MTAAVYARRGSGSWEAIGQIPNALALPPGGSEQVEWVWEPGSAWASALSLGQVRLRVVVDDDGQGGQRHNECDEGDNEIERDVECELAG